MLGSEVGDRSTRARSATSVQALPRAGAVATLTAMPALALALARVTWDAGLLLAHGVESAPSLALSTVTIADLLTVVAGAAGTAASAYLSLAALLLFATPRRSRARAAVMRLTPGGWRRVVSVAATGALSAGLAFPAAAAPDSSDAGWVPEPLAPAEALAPPVLAPILPAPGESGGEPPDNPGPSPRSASGPPAQPAPPIGGAPAPDYVVATGDSLWTIAADALEGDLADGMASSDVAEIAAAWPALFEANRETVGADPGLIHPGQRLVVPDGWTS